MEAKSMPNIQANFRMHGPCKRGRELAPPQQHNGSPQCRVFLSNLRVCNNPSISGCRVGRFGSSWWLSMRMFPSIKPVRWRPRRQLICAQYEARMIHFSDEVSRDLFAVSHPTHQSQVLPAAKSVLSKSIFIQVWLVGV